MRLTSAELIGRRAELRTLDHELSQAVRGQLRFVLVSGPAGMGKSALVRRSTDAARRAGAQVIVAECAREDTSRPFGPLLLAGNGAFADVLERRGGERPAPLDAAVRHRAFARVVARLRDGAHDRPVVLVVEDAQWADEETLRLLPYLGRRAADAGLLVVATFRSEDAGSVPLSSVIAELRSRHAVEIDLPPLTEDQVGLLTRSLLGSTGLPAGDVRSFVTVHSGGNPLFVEELVRGLVERRWLALMEGTWRPAGPLAEAVLPTSIGANVRARIGPMPADVRRILSSAAVIGQRFTLDLLTEITSSPHLTVVGALRSGIDAGLIEERPVDALGYAFRHALFRDALLEELIGPERQDLHRAVGLALEAGIPDAERSSAAAELAHHFEAAGDADRAVLYHLMALRVSSHGAVLAELIPITSNAGVARHLERALALAPADHPDRAEMLRAYAWAQEDPAQRLRIIDESLAQARRAVDERGVGLSTVMAGVWRALQGDTSALPTIAEGIRTLEMFGTSQDLADARYQLARVAMVIGDAAAVPLGERAVEHARARGSPVLLANALATLGPALVRAGRAEGIDVVRSGLAIARENAAEFAVNRSLSNLWMSLVRSGAPDDEIREVERWITIELPDAGMAERWFELRLMWTLFDDGWDEILELADEWSFPPFDQSPIAAVITAYVLIAREGPGGHLDRVLRAHRRIEGRSPMQGGQATLAPELLHLCGDHRAALDAARYVAVCMNDDVRAPFIDTAACAALASAVASRDDAATQMWLGLCARRHVLEAATAEGRREYARGEEALRAGRLDEALVAFACSAEAFQRRGATLLARTLPRLRRAELLAGSDGATAQRELAHVMAMWRAVDAKWYLGRLRTWADAHGLRGWTVSRRRGPRLTPREMEVARRVAEGLTNREISAALGITERTAETHVQRILAKLDLRGRAQVAAWFAGSAATAT